MKNKLQNELNNITSSEKNNYWIAKVRIRATIYKRGINMGYKISYGIYKEKTKTIYQVYIVTISRGLQLHYHKESVKVS